MKTMDLPIRRLLIGFWEQRQPREQILLGILGLLLLGAGLWQGGQWLVEQNEALATRLPVLRADVERLEARPLTSARRSGEGIEAGVRQLTLMFPGLESHPVEGGVELHWRGKQLVSWLQALDRVAGRTAWVVRSADIERQGDGVDVRLVVAVR